MSLYNFLDSIDLTLEKNLKSYDNSFIDNFIDELKFSLYQHNVSKKSNLDYKELPKDTIFYVDYIEEGYASCFDTTQKNSEKYEIPSNLLDISIKMGGSYIQFNGEKYVNVSKPKDYHLYD